MCVFACVCVWHNGGGGWFLDVPCWSLLWCRVSMVGGTWKLIRETHRSQRGYIHLLWPRLWGRAGEGERVLGGGVRSVGTVCSCSPGALLVL